MQNPPIGYSGQYLDNHAFRIKIRTGSDIHNATGDSVLGELFLETGINPSETQVTGKLYCATATVGITTPGSANDQHIFHVADIITPVVGPFRNDYSISLDGATSFADLNSTVTSNGACSISLWVNYETSASHNWFYLFSMNHPLLYIDGASESINSPVGGSTPGSSLPKDQWNHVAWTRDGSNNVTIYINGSLVQVNGSNTFVDANSVSLSHLFRHTNGTLAFNGFCDEIAVWTSTELTAAQVAGIWNNGVPNDLDSLSPTHWWRCGDSNGGSGSTVSDVIAGNNMTISNATFAPSDFPNADSVDFDGTTSGYGSIGDIGADAYAVSLWFKPDAVVTPSSSVGVVLSLNGWESIAFGDLTGSVTNELILVTTVDGNNRRSAYTAPGGTISAAWHHLLINFNTNVYEIWLDGVRVDNATAGGPQAVITASNVRVGEYFTNGFEGLIDELAIWGTAPLSAGEIALIYNRGRPANLAINVGAYTSASNLVGWWRMGDNDGGSGSTVTDKVSGNDMTLQSGAVIVQDVP